MLEVLADRNRRCKRTGRTDQWIQQADSVVLKAIWLRIKSAVEIVPDEWYSTSAWNPDDERCPQGGPGGLSGGFSEGTVQGATHDSQSPAGEQRDGARGVQQAPPKQHLDVVEEMRRPVTTTSECNVGHLEKRPGGRK